jgi:hypothetical protein
MNGDSSVLRTMLEAVVHPDVQVPTLTNMAICDFGQCGDVFELSIKFIKLGDELIPKPLSWVKIPTI